MATQNTTLVKLSVGATPVAVACQTSTSFEISRDLVETSCKDNNGFKTYRPGLKGGSMQVEGYVDYSAASSASPVTLATACLGGTLLEVDISSSESGGHSAAGFAFVENYSENADGVEDVLKYSATLRLSGTFTVG